MKFSIRFKLTLWYALMLTIMILLYVVVTTIVIQQHYKKDPRDVMRQMKVDTSFGNGQQFNRAQVDEYIDQVRREDFRRVQMITFSLLVALSILSFVGGYIIAGRMLFPLKKINHATRHMDAHRLSDRIAYTDTNDEFSELAQNFNAMIDRLAYSFNAQRAFIENVSHELKTPLTISQIHLEALKESKNLGEEEKKEYIEKALQSTVFLNQLIEDILLLSLTQEDVPMKKIEILPLLEDAVNQLESFAQKQGKKITYTPASFVGDDTRTGNATLLQRAFMNCIENAIYYSKKNIIIAVQKKDEKIEIVIRDDGMGIAEEEREKIWERFYRVDASRSRNTGGAGVGLSITKNIMTLHGGKVSIDSDGASYTAVTFIL